MRRSTRQGGGTHRSETARLYGLLAPFRHAARGFSLIELLVVISLISTVTAAGTVALRHHFRVRALESAQQTLVTQLNLVQQRSTSESYPNIYGVRFTKGSRSWAVVRLDAKGGTCSVVTSHTFDQGITVTSDASTVFPLVAGSTACAAAAPGGGASNAVVFFYPSGRALGGSVTLQSDAIGRSRAVSVSSLTGRVAAQ